MVQMFRQIADHQEITMQTDTITIAGLEFLVPVRYAAGHPLTEAEADALNQTYHENIGNNFRKKVKDLAGEGEPDEDQLATLQAELSAYAEGYEFGVRVRTGKAPVNPVEKEALALVKAAIRAKLKTLGKKADAEQISAKAGEVVADKDGVGAKFWELARKRVEEAKAAASDTLDDAISSIPEKVSEE
jgi:hypothetical protein